ADVRTYRGEVCSKGSARSPTCRAPRRDHPLGLFAGRAPFFGFTGLAPGLGASALVSTTGAGSSTTFFRPKRPPLRPGCTGLFGPLASLAVAFAGRAPEPVLAPAICGGGNFRSTHCCWPRVNRLFVTQ